MKRKSYISLSLLLAFAAAQTPAAATRADHLNTVTSGILRYSASGHGTSDKTSVSAQTGASDQTSAQAQTDASNHTSAQAQTDASNQTSAQAQAGASVSVSSASDIEKLVNPLAGGLKDSEGYAGTEVPALSGLSQPQETEAGSAGPAKNGKSASGKDTAETDVTPAAEASTETEVPSMPLSQDNGVIGEDAETESDVSQTVKGFFQSPDIDGYNAARVSLYDYRMLRDYPLPSLPRDLHTLYDQIKAAVAGYSGTWSVYVEDLSTRQALIVGDQPMKSASVMKLFVMAAVYEQIDNGEIERTDEVVSLLHDMISNSSNEAANRLLLLLGKGDYAKGIRAVNRYISSHGYSKDTREYNGFEDDAAIVDGSHFNQINAKDIGLLLEHVYTRSFISRNVCNEIEDMMLNQATRYKIPRGLPDDVEVANKTGEMDTVENDAALVFGGRTDFILVVLSEDWDSKNTAQEEIQDLAGMVYNYLN
jgi:beta-lactamase class A